MSTTFSWGAERDYIENNPAKQVKKVKRPKDLARANRPWTENEWATVLNTAAPHVKPLIAALLYTGIDPCDAISLRKTKYKDGAFDLSRQKTGNPVWKPVPAALKRILSAMPKHDAITLFANSYGKPWTKSGFDSVWMKLRNDLELPKGLTLKGLRHTHATMLRESGASHREVADALGDKSEAMGGWYSRDADLKSGQEKVIKAFDKKHGKLSNRSKRSVKP
jgi:integrase